MPDKMMSFTNDADETSDFDVVALDPACYYDHPRDVLTDTALTLAQKTRLLEEWHADLTRKLESDAEGMTHACERQSADDAAMLRQASKALRALKGEEPAEVSITSSDTLMDRIWQRIVRAVS